MSELISRQAAINALIKRDKELRNINWYDKPFSEGECKGIDYALEIVNALPSEQPGIIKCRDCKYWREHKYAKETKRYIPFCGFNAIYTKADDFCSRAERRTE